MNDITINFSDNVTLAQKVMSRKVIRKVLEYLQQPSNVEVCVSVVNDEEIKKLNKEQRGKNKVTDVLSFPALDIKPGQKIKKQDILIDKAYLGDIVICDDQIKRQAEEYGISYHAEFMRMVLHSVLHLLGYDHIEAKDKKIMHAVEYPIYEKLTKIRLY